MTKRGIIKMLVNMDEDSLAQAIQSFFEKKRKLGNERISLYESKPFQVIREQLKRLDNWKDADRGKASENYGCMQKEE